MWNKQSEAPAPSTSQWQPPQAAPAPTSAGIRTSPSSAAARNLSCLGASLEIKGKISGDEDLQIDGKVEGSVALNGQRLTVGRTGKLNSEVWARELVVYGTLMGNIHASDRVEIKKDGSVTGDITTARISVEDGAYFKGRIEIERTKQSSTSDASAEPVLAGVSN
ncbi:MAG TPA: polymer-forming cytoskeletal protein [Candidatus Acidoferrales bacterium]|nr:polymer-forming cytoskeletal protein [Candidatus Acidoferrales bacterium]